MLPARWLRCCCQKGLLLLILVYSVLLLHRTWRTPDHLDIPETPETIKKKPSPTHLHQIVSRSSRIDGFPDTLAELGRAERGVGHLQSRAEEVWQSCQKTTIPKSPALRRAKEAQEVSERLALQFLTQHQTEVAKRLVYLGDRNLTWCLLPKVASTSWSRALQRVSGEDSDNSAPQIPLRLKHRPPSSRNLPSMVRNSESFLFIRHPFERLVTAYRSKLEDTSAQHDGDYFYSLYGRKIVGKYRKLEVAETNRNLNKMEERKTLGKNRIMAVNKKNLIRVEWRGNSLIEVDESLGLDDRGVSAEGDTRNLVNLETNMNLNRIDLGSVENRRLYLGEDAQFDEKFIDKDGGLARNVDRDHTDPRNQPVTRDPTFEEFVDYLLDTDPFQYDEHWMPAALYCDVCTLKYNFILMYEDFQMENEEFIRYLVAKGNLPTDFTLKWENKIGTDIVIVKRYLSLIPPDKLQRLIVKFEQDFSLFQYDPYSFL